MDWRLYGEFVVFAVILILIPGPDFAVTAKNALVGGRRRGCATAFGISASNVCQGTASAAGLGALIVQSQPLFETIRWCGVAYLLYLAAQAVRSAVRVRQLGLDLNPDETTRSPWRGWQQGFLSNITNPKVLAFYVAVLPQFMTRSTTTVQVLALVLTHAVLGLVWLLAVVATVDRARRLLMRRRVRQTLDATTGVVLAAFAARLAVERA